MPHLYLFTLEIALLEVGKTYDELPSHVTLMSRFLSDLLPEELTDEVQPLFAKTAPIPLVFGETIQLGSKKVTAHMVTSSDEIHLHNDLRELLDRLEVSFQYPEFIGDNHKPHVTAREGVRFSSGSKANVHTDAGNIDLRFLVSPTSIVAKAADGNIDITVPQGQAFQVRAETSSGQRTVAVPQDSTVARHIDAQTSSGNVTIQNF